MHSEADVVVVVQLPIQPVHITINVVRYNSAHGVVFSIQHCVLRFISDMRQVGDFLRILLFPPPIKLTGLNIFVILLNVVLNTITITPHVSQ